MWIRSQDKRFLVDINIAFVVERQIVGITSYAICYHKEIDIDLGVYSTYEKALEVLDMMEQCINGYINEKTSKFLEYCIFKLPQDEEV